MRPGRLALTIAALAVLVVPAGADVNEDWVAEYDGPAGLDDAACAVATDPYGNVYVTGKSEKADAFDDFATVKYDATGSVVWARLYDGVGGRIDNARDIAVDASGNAYVVGLSWNDTTDYDYATVKYDPFGNEEWVAFYNGSGDCADYPSVIAVDGAGNVYVAGFSCKPGPNPDCVTIKYGADGGEEWVATYSGPRDLIDLVRDIAVDDAGYVYVTGQSEGTGTSSDFVTIKYAPNGDEEWVARYDGPGHNADSGYAIGLDDVGNVYVTGESWNPDREDDIVTIMYDADGVEEWVAIYNGPASDDDIAQGISVHGSGYVRVAGMSRGSGVDFDYVTIAYDSEGTEEWVSRYDGGDGDDLALALVTDDAGNTYVTGRSWGGVGTCYDYATVKYDIVGAEEWVARYDGKGGQLDEALDIALDSAGRVCVTGRTGDGMTGYDYATIVYSQGGATGIDEGAGLACRVQQSMPNPFSATSTLSFELRGPAEVSVSIHDVSGRLVRTLLADAGRGVGCHAVSWHGLDNDGQQASSGVYFFRIAAGTEAVTRKTVFLR